MQESKLKDFPKTHREMLNQYQASVTVTPCKKSRGAEFYVSIIKTKKQSSLKKPQTMRL